MSGIKNRIQPGDGDRRHGSPGGYTNHGCRCDACRVANTVAQRARREERYLEQPPSHGASAYTNWGCRCDKCRRAHTEKRRNWVSRKKAT